MPQSLEALSLPASLRGVLSNQVTDGKFAEELLHPDCAPVLFMLSGHAVTAFAVGLQADYELLYPAFKKRYLKQSTEWSTKDVSFVFCLPQGATIDESFCSRIEVDVYFCRKYVIQLGQDLLASLARLPFLPLVPVSGTAGRPPTAQTLLAHRNMKAALAAAIVMPSRMSAESILTACLEGKYGPPHQVDGTAESSAERVTEERVQATLKSISITNFRAYREKKEFELGAAITVLYGPNGFGKTSFFDAVDFAATGGVQRLNMSSSDFVAAARHLDSGEEEAVVSLTLERDGKQYVVSRNLSDPTSAWVDGKTTNRKDVLSLLTGGLTGSADRVENMVALFRATHLFSQDSQELTQDVASKCELPADLVSRMLAFEDYVGGLKKTNDVLKLARQRAKQAKLQAEQTELLVKADKLELARLEALASAQASPEQLEARFGELEQAIELAGFDLVGISIRDTRGVRAKLDATVVEANARRDSAGIALESLINLRELNQYVEPLRARLEEWGRDALRLDASAAEATRRAATLASELAERKAAGKSAQNKRDLLRWAFSAYPTYDRLSAEVLALNGGLAELAAKRDLKASRQRDAANARQSAATVVKQRQEAQVVAADARLNVHSLLNNYLEWQHLAPELDRLSTDIGELQRTIEAKRQQIAEMRDWESAQELKVSSVDRDLQAARENDSSLKSLIADLRTHIEGSTCVLCGHDHGSEETLRAAIDRRLELSDEVIRLTTLLGGETERLKVQSAQRQAIAEQMSQENARLLVAQNERNALVRRWAQIETLLKSLGFEPSIDASETLAHRKDELARVEWAAAESTVAAKAELTAAEQALTDAQLGLENVEREHTVMAMALESANGQLGELVRQARNGALNFELGFAALSEAQTQAEAELNEALGAVEASSSLLEAAKASDAAAKAALAAAQIQKQHAATAWSEHQAQMAREITALFAASYSIDSTEQKIRDDIQAETNRAASATNLSSRVSEIEVAVDTAATSAAFESIRSRIETNQKAAVDARAEVSQLEPWVKYFEEVAKLLESQQAFATDHFINEYGPRTAVIQQRLRPVYGFGDIEVSSNGTAIGIRVKRNGADLRPTDYFSQSQVQTLVLGLFLTACSSQTWSGFSSIMMDDPVTHFDDLNTYALLDLISGLQNSPEGARQFVISTCDEKLLQLARQKFRHLGEAAKFYRFQAIGAGGPVVAEIPA